MRCHGSLCCGYGKTSPATAPPFTFRIGAHEWDLSVRMAGALASAASLIERSIVNADRAAS